jgi:hypothetical protein
MVLLLAVAMASAGDGWCGAAADCLALAREARHVWLEGIVGQGRPQVLDDRLAAAERWFAIACAEGSAEACAERLPPLVPPRGPITGTARGRFSIEIEPGRAITWVDRGEPTRLPLPARCRAGPVPTRAGLRIGCGTDGHAAMFLDLGPRGARSSALAPPSDDATWVRWAAAPGDDRVAGVYRETEFIECPAVGTPGGEPAISIEALCDPLVNAVAVSGRWIAVTYEDRVVRAVLEGDRALDVELLPRVPRSSGRLALDRAGDLVFEAADGAVVRWTHQGGIEDLPSRSAAATDAWLAVAPYREERAAPAPAWLRTLRDLPPLSRDIADERVDQPAGIGSRTVSAIRALGPGGEPVPGVELRLDFEPILSNDGVTGPLVTTDDRGLASLRELPLAALTAVDFELSDDVGRTGGQILPPDAGFHSADRTLTIEIPIRERLATPELFGTVVLHSSSRDAIEAVDGTAFVPLTGHAVSATFVGLRAWKAELIGEAAPHWTEVPAGVVTAVDPDGRPLAGAYLRVGNMQVGAMLPTDASGQLHLPLSWGAVDVTFGGKAQSAALSPTGIEVELGYAACGADASPRPSTGDEMSGVWDGDGDTLSISRSASGWRVESARLGALEVVHAFGLLTSAGGWTAFEADPDTLVVRGAGAGSQVYRR